MFPANDFYIQTQMRAFQAQLDLATQSVSRAKNITELIRANNQALVAAPSVIRAITRGGAEMRRFTVAATQRGESIIDQSLQALMAYKLFSEEDFTSMAGQFIQTVREPCRGHFPHLYHRADRGLIAIKTWRHQNLTPPDTKDAFDQHDPHTAAKTISSCKP